MPDLLAGFDQPRIPLMKGRIIDPAVCNGRPTVLGTRITVQTVLEFLGAGDAIEGLLEEDTTLTGDDVIAFLRYSSRPLGNRCVLGKLA